MIKKAENDAAEVTKIVRNRENLRKMDYNNLLSVVKIILRAYDDYSSYNTPKLNRNEMEGYIIDNLMAKDQVFGVTHELLGKINEYSTEFKLNKEGLIKKDD